MTVFKFKSGANPYIAKTEKETERLLKKYKGRITEQVINNIEIFTVNDKIGGLKNGN